MLQINSREFLSWRSLILPCSSSLKLCLMFEESTQYMSPDLFGIFFTFTGKKLQQSMTSTSFPRSINLSSLDMICCRRRASALRGLSLNIMFLTAIYSSRGRRFPFSTFFESKRILLRLLRPPISIDSSWSYLIIANLWSAYSFPAPIILIK